MSTRFIDELRISSHAEEQLSARGVGADEVLEVLWGKPRFFRDKVQGRDLMIGPTDGANTTLTVVIEPTKEAGVWDVVTGWVSSKGEETRWRNAT